MFFLNEIMLRNQPKWEHLCLVDHSFVIVMLFGNNILLFCLKMPFECHVNSFSRRCHICRNMPLWVSRRADCVGCTREKFEANIHCQTAYFAVVIDSCFELLVPPGAAFPVPDWQLNMWRNIMADGESRFCSWRSRVKMWRCFSENVGRTVAPSIDGVAEQGGISVTGKTRLVNYQRCAREMERWDS